MAASPSPAAIVGSYRLERLLGKGGMGEVWVGRHVATGGVAAVKLLRADRDADQLFHTLFARERRAISRLAHPNIVRLFEIGPDYLAMALVEGVDLGKKLRAPMNPAVAVAIALQIASALEHAHGMGVVHRDVNPANILLDRQGNAYLADFGLADLLDEERGVDVGGGTAGYAAPEQVRGGQPSPLADQYALGRTLLRMLVGAELPAIPDEAFAVLPAELPGEVLALLVRATAADPGRRFASMTDLTSALARVDLTQYPPPRRLAVSVRPAAGFRWCAGAVEKRVLAPQIVEARYTLAALERLGLVPAADAAAFRAATGHADFGWSVFGHEARLGPIDQPSALARAEVVVVLLHGFLSDRAVWAPIAAALCRDNARTLVVAPDVAGFGESRFAGDPEPNQVTPSATARAVLAWLRLLATSRIPTILVGHSMSAMALLSLRDDELDPAISRVALTPLFPEESWRVRAAYRLGAAALRLGARPGVRGYLSRHIVRGAGADTLTAAQGQRFVDHFLASPPALLAGIAAGCAAMRCAPADQLRRCQLVIGVLDRNQKETVVVSHAVHRLGIPIDQVHRFATGGHYPHLEDAQHPEWTARNQDELVRLLDRVVGEARRESAAGTMKS